MQEDIKLELPLPTIRRYPIYLRAIQRMIARGEMHISSAVLAEELRLDPVLTRKDLAMAGIPGKPRRGYPAKELSDAMTRALGWDSVTDAVLIGVGSLGQALLGYSGFEEQSLQIAMAFDDDPNKVNKSFHDIKVHPMEELKTLANQLQIKIGILTVTADAAQSCAEKLVDAGIKGILNFSPVQLSVPADVIVQNVDLAQSLAVLSHRIVHN